MTESEPAREVFTETFEIQRLALTLLQADHAGDAGQATAVLASVTEPQIGIFLLALADLVSHAHAAPTGESFSAFITRHRRAIDAAEQQHMRGKA